MENLWPLIPTVNGKPLFARSEFDSKDPDGSGLGTGDKMHPQVVWMLVAMRHLLGRQLVINSGFRTVKHNRAEGGVSHSPHLEGLAADVKTANFKTAKNWTKAQRLEFINVPRMLGFNGVGIANTYIHIDIRPRVASWRYVPHGQAAIAVGDEGLWV